MVTALRLRDYAGCAVLGYEIFAVLTDLVPSLTSIVRAARYGPVLVYAASVLTVVAGLVYLGWHLLVDGEW